MKLTQSLLAASLMTMCAASGYAQNQFPDECHENNSLYYEYAKQKNYADALEFWNKLYTQCPNYNKNLYILGVEIVKHEIKVAGKDATLRKAAIDKLMKLYDNRIQYFGDDAKKPTPVILGEKAIDRKSVV